MKNNEWKENAKLRATAVELWINYKMQTLTFEAIMWNERQRERLRHGI